MNTGAKALEKGFQVMVVDDDPTFRNFMAIQLELLGCRVTALEGGEAAWERLRKERPDLVLSDVFMPGLNGIDLCARIKSDPELREIPVVLLTMAGPKAKDEGYKAGADDFLNKPPHMLELWTRLRNLLLLQSLRLAGPDPGAGETGPGGPPSVLVLESYGILRQHVASVLAQEGHAVREADSIPSFLEALDTERPDLVLIDQDLIEGPGSTLAARLRSQAATAAIPILLMCDAGALEPGGNAWQASADEHLVKPFEAPELKARVAALLKQVGATRKGGAAAASPEALKDPRTGAYGRPFFHASLDILCSYSNLAGTPLSLLACQVPGPAETLPARIAEAAGRLRDLLLPHEFLCRLREDLLVAVLPGSDEQGLADRVARAAPVHGLGRLIPLAGAGEPAALLFKRLQSQLWKEP